MAKRQKGRAWVKQLARQVRKFGTRKAPWYWLWYDPAGKSHSRSCGAGTAGKRDAEALRNKLNSQMTLGEYKDETENAILWDDFVAKYVRDALADCRTSTILEVRTSLNHFGRLLKLKGKAVSSISHRSVSEFVGKRRLEGGRKRLTEATEEGEKPIAAPISVATLNKDLRHIKAALRTAFKWKYLPEVPDVSFAREDSRLPRYLIIDHFQMIYDACEAATLPDDGHYQPVDWWRGLLTLLYLTGWRIGEALSLEWRDVDMETGVAMTRAEANKGRKDSLVALHPVVLEHLRALRGFREQVFHWTHSRRRLQDTLDAIQERAGVRIDCNIRTQHVCTDSCHRYSFHDLRRAFATNNVARLPAEVLQKLMRHSSYSTTQRYIKMAKELQPILSDVFVPTCLQSQQPESEIPAALG